MLKMSWRLWIPAHARHTKPSLLRNAGKRTRALISTGYLVLATACQPGCSPQSQPKAAASIAGTQNAISPTSQTDTPAPLSSLLPEPFDGGRAYTLLKQQCDFGVRPLGTTAHEKLREFLTGEMHQNADQTVLQRFAYHDLPVTNIIGVFYPVGASKPDPHPILLLAHWDTRPIADGPYSSEVKKGVSFRYGSHGWNPISPIMGADDGASGVAVMLELARLFHKKRPAVGVVLLFDDGEDYGDFQAMGQKGDGIELGSRYFARHYKENTLFGRPSYGILLDMVGAKDAFFPRETFSQRDAAFVNDKVFGTAQALGYEQVFRSQEDQQVGDDHLALNDAGIPTADIIHPLPYGNYEQTGYTYWHTLEDTPDKCSAKTLQIIGDVIANVVYRELPGK